MMTFATKPQLHMLLWENFLRLQTYGKYNAELKLNQ